MQVHYEIEKVYSCTQGRHLYWLHLKGDFRPIAEYHTLEAAEEHLEALQPTDGPTQGSAP